jgi:hypothetical protein
MTRKLRGAQRLFGITDLFARRCPSCSPRSRCAQRPSASLICSRGSPAADFGFTRRQFSDIVTFSVVYRTKENVQRWQKLERFPILTPHLARQEAIRVLRAKALGQDPAGDKMALRNGMTVAELCDQYSARDNGKKLGTIRSDNSRIKKHIKPKLGKMRIASITSVLVEQECAEIRPRSLRVGLAQRHQIPGD